MRGARWEIVTHPQMTFSQMLLVAETPKSNLTFLVTQFGKPFTATGFGYWSVSSVSAPQLSPGGATTAPDSEQ